MCAELIKKCRSCASELSISEFLFMPLKSGKPWWRKDCKSCENKQRSVARKNDPSRKAKLAEYYQKNKKKLGDRTRSWESRNKQRVLEKARIREKVRRETDPLYKATELLKCRARHYRVTGTKAGFELLGCTQAEFREHIQRQFKPGMNWNNHGVRGWHYDHIFPLAKCKNEEELIRACRYTNIQPLWWHENNLKRDKIPEGAKL